MTAVKHTVDPLQGEMQQLGSAARAAAAVLALAPTTQKNEALRAANAAMEARGTAAEARTAAVEARNAELEARIARLEAIRIERELEELRKEKKFTVEIRNLETPLSSLWALDLDPVRVTRLTRDTTITVATVERLRASCALKLIAS